MLSIIRERLRQGRRTIAYPAGEMPSLPDRFRGLPVLDESRCPDGCQACAVACPTDAVRSRRQWASGSTWADAFSAPTASRHVRKERSAITQDHRLAIEDSRRPGPPQRARAGARPAARAEDAPRLRPLAQAPPGECWR